MPNYTQCSLKHMAARNPNPNPTLTEGTIDPVSTLVFFIKPVIFPIDPSAGRHNAFLHTSFNISYTFFSWLEEMTFLQRFIIFLVAISAALSVNAAPVQVRHPARCQIT